jgi:hypothetical protein
VGNSSYLNGDVEITCGNSELRQTNHHVNPLVCLLVFLPSVLLEEIGALINPIGCMSRLLYLCSISCNIPYMQS